MIFYDNPFGLVFDGFPFGDFIIVVSVDPCISGLSEEKPGAIIHTFFRLLITKELFWHILCRRGDIMANVSQRVPDACAKIKGITQYPKINGKVCFYSVHGGTVVESEIYGLPENEKQMIGNFFGFHIHEGDSCSGDEKDLLKNTGGHYNPLNVEHPNHAGDLIPLLSVGDKAWSSFYTGRFYPEDIIGKTVVIHDMPDDFRSQPAGNSGKKIACGVIREIRIEETE